MREPYETLLGPYRGHWLLGPYLWEEVPDFAGLAADERQFSLSDGEVVVWTVALAIRNRDETATIADLWRLDANTRLRVLRALELTCGT